MNLEEKVQSLIDAANAATGEADTNLTDAVGTLIAGQGGGITPTASFLSKNEVSATIASYPFVPKHQTELVVWTLSGNNAPTEGSITPWAYFLWIHGGVANTNNSAGWLTGTLHTAPWSSKSPIRFSARNTSFYFDEQGRLTVATEVWGFWGKNNTCTVYEIALPEWN